jgi:hypothetical protein
MWQKLKLVSSLLITLCVIIGMFIVIFNRCSNVSDLKNKNKQRKMTIAEFVGRSTGSKKRNIFSIKVNDKFYMDNGFSSLYLVVGEQFECEYLESTSPFTEYLFVVNEHKPIIRDSSLFRYTHLAKLDIGSWFNAHRNIFSYLVEGKEYKRELHCDTLNSNMNLYKVFYNSQNPQIGYLIKK